MQMNDGIEEHNPPKKNTRELSIALILPTKTGETSTTHLPFFTGLARLSRHFS
ncbi:hypothetical protein MtrunA17_Chr2g0289381 [Medicago truncatula]|uniref:Uncharacterized protein n=1 Tax=Medicago truncatula TaxID=3880 RepID=A0A396J6T1_MEDTR|nr:hypothetical protein MtrunA17_Chr2g0289381 [Medicago truncatula]